MLWGIGCMKVLLVSFVYPIIKLFLIDFFNSLNNQTIKEFDTLIFDDKLNENLKKYGYFGEIIKNETNLSIAGVRKFIINYAIKMKYDLLVFCDADDVMENNRIEKIIEEYKKTNGEFGFYYNDLYLLEGNKDFYNGKLIEKVNSLEELKNYNFLGMSHTSINLNKTKNIWNDFIIDDNIIAFDWYMHSYLIYRGYKGKKVDTKTYYRIYENNIAGNTNILNDKKLKMGLKVKKEHYKIMMTIDYKFQKMFQDILKLEKKLKKISYKNKYIKHINKFYSDNIYWWENIKSLDEIGGELDD